MPQQPAGDAPAARTLILRTRASRDEISGGFSRLAAGPDGSARDCLGQERRVLGELHRDLSYLMMGKGVSVAGADREEAPGPKPEPTGREPGSQA